MTHIMDRCLEQGCTNPGGLRLLCAEHLPQYEAPTNDNRDTFSDDVDPAQREIEGKATS